MKDIYQKIINTLKNAEDRWDDVVSNIIAEYSGHQAKEYDEATLNQLMQNILCEYIDECSDPDSVLSNYLDLCQVNPGCSTGYIIAELLIKRPPIDTKHEPTVDITLDLNDCIQHLERTIDSSNRKTDYNEGFIDGIYFALYDIKRILKNKKENHADAH